MSTKGATVQITQDLLNNVSFPRYNRTIIIVLQHTQQSITIGDFGRLLFLLVFILIVLYFVFRFVILCLVFVLLFCILFLVLSRWVGGCRSYRCSFIFKFKEPCFLTNLLSHFNGIKHGWFIKNTDKRSQLSYIVVMYSGQVIRNIFVACYVSHFKLELRQKF